MTKIIGFGHFKQSGKSSSCEFLRLHILNAKTIYKIPEGMDAFGNTDFEGWKYNKGVKVYSFADKLKQFCIEVLGLTHDQCYGSDEQKNSLTHLRWENMPGVTCDSCYLGMGMADLPKELVYHNPGFMTAREVLQYFGTGICRKMYNNVWVDATIRQIKQDDLDFALIEDCRFRNEADALKQAGGKVIGFTRRPHPEDNHSSEIDLIGYNFDLLIDNKDLSLDAKNNLVLQALKDWKFL